jgi:hypothetical protein
VRKFPIRTTDAPLIGDVPAKRGVTEMIVDVSGALPFGTGVRSTSLF